VPQQETPADDHDRFEVLQLYLYGSGSMIRLFRVPLDKARSTRVVFDHCDNTFMTGDSPVFALSSTGLKQIGQYGQGAFGERPRRTSASSPVR